MLALMDELPKFCPNCGHVIEMSRECQVEYFGHVTMMCLRNCGFEYVYVSGPTLAKTAEAAGSDFMRVSRY